MKSPLPHSIHTIYTIYKHYTVSAVHFWSLNGSYWWSGWGDHSLCCCCILYWSWCHMLRVLAPALDSGPLPHCCWWHRAVLHWSLVTPCACCVPVCCWWCCSVQWGCCWLTRGCCPRTASPPQPPLPVQPPPSPHLSIHPSTAAKTSTNIFWGQIILGLSLKLILNPHNKDF